LRFWTLRHKSIISSKHECIKKPERRRRCSREATDREEQTEHSGGGQLFEDVGSNEAIATRTKDSGHLKL
jgi:hypothetical protein